MTIINLTQHQATQEQIEAGVVDLPPNARALLIKFLTVEELPGQVEINQRCDDIAFLVLINAGPSDVNVEGNGSGFGYHAMIGGAPWMMAPLERALMRLAIEPMYAFSKRESVETIQPDGGVKKTQIFRHAGWVGITADHHR